MAYDRAFQKGTIKDKDPVYTTWAYLKKTVQMPKEPAAHP